MTTMRRVRALAAAFTLALVQATPAIAVAGAGIPSWACGPGDSAGSTARGGFADARGVVREPDLGQVTSKVPPKTNAAPVNLQVTVPIYFHVITSGTTGNLTDRQLRDQVSQMNAAYGGSYGGAATGFSWTFAGVDRTNNATWYASKSGGAEHAMKTALKVPGDNVLNVWTTDGPSYLGFATFPSWYKRSPQLDGIVLDYKSFPGGPYGSQYSLGKTATHEVGHWLGLLHTFQGACNAKGDYIDDTPAEATPTSGCPAGKDTCTAPGTDPIRNYMDYSYDSCYDQFTPDQADRMHDQWAYFRAGGGTSVGG